MAASAEQAVRHSLDLERKLHAKLAEANAPYSEIAALLQDYRVACEKAIFCDFEYAIAQGIETGLWNGHTKVSNTYRKRLQKLHRGGKDSVVEFRKAGKEYLDFIKASQRFYRRYILELDSHFTGIPELRRAAQKWQQNGSNGRVAVPANPELARKVLGSCHQTLIRLGDLSRWRESELGDQQRNWGPATGFYALAGEINPDSGISFNQQAVIAVAEGNHFRTTYYLYRSLTTKEKHPQAKHNLELEFKKISSAWEKGQLIRNARSRDVNGATTALTGWFVRLHSKCYKGDEFPEHAELEKEVLGHLTNELKERALEGTPLKMILINIAAEYFATVRLQANFSSQNQLSYFYFLRLNIKTFQILLQIMQPELECLTDGDDVTVQNAAGTKQLSDNVTIVMRRILPSLRIYSTWFTCFWQIVSARVTEMVSIAQVEELWSSYANILTLLASSFPADKLPTDEYMLEEDVDIIGFQPLIDKKTKHIWYSNGVLKPRFSDKNVQRQGLNIEMLMRIRDFLVDGLHLVQDQDAPLTLDGIQFKYQEITAVEPVAPEAKLDQTASHVQDQQQSSSRKDIYNSTKSNLNPTTVPDSTSFTLSKDEDMNRMVDDLVGHDDPLDPLNEAVDDEDNMPPTPPEQTFEDTTLVNDSTYGIAPIATDLVNMGQSNNHSICSPGTPLSSARMPSSPSIRQFPSLPSLPDQSSIWNRNYGSPAPSSPYLGNDLAYVSPMSHNHSRGPSLSSIRSSIIPDIPVTPQSAGGPNTSYSFAGGPANVVSGWYPNGNHPLAQQSYQPQGDGSAMSSILYNAASGHWASDLQRTTSSYGRTPPNGQGG